jgi:CubicO group peptidase (beta-lactamase class C family)
VTAPVANAAFAPSDDARPAPPFLATLDIEQTPMVTQPTLVTPIVQGRDARLFPATRLTLQTINGRLVPRERGAFVSERGSHKTPSYWSVIAETGRVWRETADGEWSRAALPINLVNDTENAASQGLLTFLYRGTEVSSVRIQLVQQTAPYLVKPHFTAAALAPAHATAVAASPDDERQATLEWSKRLPVQPLSALAAQVPAGTLDGFGGPLLTKWRVAVAIVAHDTLFQAPVETPFGPYPYPEGMRFGVRSVMKSVAAPLAMLHLAEQYGPWVLDLKIGDYVSGLDAKYRDVRFIDAASMASGFGGQGTLRTHPNDMYDGYLGGDYDAWYVAPSHAEKLAQIRRTLTPYPWAPGTVVRYRDQDFYLLGIAIDGLLKQVRGGDHADLWEMLSQEVFAPIGIFHTPAVHTQEPQGHGHVWANAGYYPTLDDLAKIALLYQRRGEWEGHALLHRGLVEDLLSAKGALDKAGDAARPADAKGPIPRYRMGFHFLPYVARQTGRGYEVPSMQGSGENEVILAPNGMISIRTAKAAGLPEGTTIFDDDTVATLRVLDRLEAFHP